MVHKKFFQQRNMFQFCSYAEDACIFHSIPSNWKSPQLRSTPKTLSYLCNSHWTQPTVINQKHSQSFCLTQIVKKTCSSKRVDCVVADIHPQKGTAHKTLRNEFNRFWNFILESSHEHVVYVEILSIHQKLPRYFWFWRESFRTLSKTPKSKSFPRFLWLWPVRNYCCKLLETSLVRVQCC